MCPAVCVCVLVRLVCVCSSFVYSLYEHVYVSVLRSMSGYTSSCVCSSVSPVRVCATNVFCATVWRWNCVCKFPHKHTHTHCYWCLQVCACLWENTLYENIVLYEHVCVLCDTDFHGNDAYTSFFLIKLCVYALYPNVSSYESKCEYVCIYVNIKPSVCVWVCVLLFALCNFCFITLFYFNWNENLKCFTVH